MPPKKKSTSKKPAVPTIKTLRGNESFNQIMEQSACAFDNFFGNLLADTMRSVTSIFEEHSTETITVDSLKAAIFGDSEKDVLEMISRSATGSNVQSTSSKDPTPLKMSPRTPTRDMTDDEFEEEAMPNTLRRMEQLSISRKPNPPSSFSRTPQPMTPRRNPIRQAQQAPATPRAVFPTTPGRAPAPRAQVVVEDKQTGKMQHADHLRSKILEQKREKAREDEARRLAVQERRKEQERLQKEKNEANRRKEEERVLFAKQQKELKSPTRSKLPLRPVVRTPGRKLVVQTEGVPTPGRVAAKKGRVEVFAAENGTRTVAQPTVQISPSRNLARSARREPTLDPMDIDEPTPRVKAKAKTKRSQRTTSPSEIASLQAAQEQYLRQQAAEERARAEEQKIAEEQRRQEEEEARLRQIQKEEEERLRRQREREEAELEATLKRQAELKAKNRTTPPAVYEMTPPRTYKAASKNDYGLNDLNSDDETDQEDDPRKEVPQWAAFAVIREAVRQHTACPPFDVAAFFGTIHKPDLKEIFGETVRAKKRGSSAVWKKSPTAGKNRAPLQNHTRHHVNN